MNPMGRGVNMARPPHFILGRVGVSFTVGAKRPAGSLRSVAGDLGSPSFHPPKQLSSALSHELAPRMTKTRDFRDREHFCKLWCLKEQVRVPYGGTPKVRIGSTP